MEAAAAPPPSPDAYTFPHEPSVAPISDDARGELGRLAHQLGFNHSDLDYVLIADRIADRDLAAGKPGRDPEAAWQQLSAQHGDKADAMVRDAKSVIERFPKAERERVVELLAVTDLANDPGFVARLAGIARRRVNG
ncbi:hypothetical protein [Prosthecomicrobium sp. N25]|uniref:hypothetical protein n=1 Tax=Prosthecomicrobium sp. N25 TaxID=3129254 RepID=UPI003077D411